MNLQRSSSFGAIVASAGASVCCLGPAVLSGLAAVFGTTAFLGAAQGIRTALTPLRPVFIGLSALALGAAFYTTYRKGTCLTTGRKAMLWMVTGLVLVLIASPYWLALFQ